MTEIQQEFRTTAKFIQIAATGIEGAQLLGLDEEGAVWLFEDETKNPFTGEWEKPGWRPMSMTRLPMPLSKAEIERRLTELQERHKGGTQ